MIAAADLFGALCRISAITIADEIQGGALVDEVVAAQTFEDVALQEIQQSSTPLACDLSRPCGPNEVRSAGLSLLGLARPSQAALIDSTRRWLARLAEPSFSGARAPMEVMDRASQTASPQDDIERLAEPALEQREAAINHPASGVKLAGALSGAKEPLVASQRLAKTLIAPLAAFDTTAPDVNFGAEPERAGIVSCVILNAAMIPGWPQQRFIQSADAEQEPAGPLLPEMSDDEIIEYLVAMGADEGLGARMSLAAEDAPRFRKVLRNLAILVGLATTLFVSMRSELEELLRELQEGSTSASSPGGRNRRRLPME